MTTCTLVALSLMASTPARQADLGNGTYRNPILFADYSDPDVIRVGDEYVMVASSFHYVPGIPVLKSRDLVNWTIVGHVVPRLEMSPAYDMKGGDRYGGGVWAPAIRFHAGRYYVYFPTPNEGIFVCTAKRPEGPWTKPVAVISGGGLEDPCPFWDDDGQAYLVHSRLGAGPLILHRMSPDGMRVLDEGRTIVDDPKNLPTLEGPKFTKRDGYYTIFAPYGGVSTGAQAVLRSKSIDGPYEFRTVLKQGSTPVNGPHQGGYVETPKGEGWFLHFHSEGAYGRIAYLEPVRWVDGWPIIGRAEDGSGAGVPVQVHPMPNTERHERPHAPQTSDEFGGRTLSPQWEWNHNPVDDHWSLGERRGFLRLKALSAPDLLHARNTLTEMMQDPAFDLTVRLDVRNLKPGGRAGLTMLCDRASGIGAVDREGRRTIGFFSTRGETTGPAAPNVFLLRMHVEQETATYAYSLDGGRTFVPLGTKEPFDFSWWKAARPAIYSYNTGSAADLGSVDVDWVRYRSTKS